MDVKQIRRNNLTLLLRAFKNQPALAEATGSSDRHISQMVNAHRGMGDKVARRFEHRLKLPHGWMDRPQSGPPHTTVAEDQASYDLVTQAEADAALEKFRRLHPAFREYVLLKMDALNAYVEALPDFIKKNLQAPTQANYYEWERDMEADMARLRMRDAAHSPHQD